MTADDEWYARLTSGQPATNPSLLALALALSGKPRNRSEWEDRFAHWQKPASDTEEQEADAVARRIQRALQKCAFLTQRQWRVIKQGSYHNNTNVRAGSDIDLCVCLTDAFYFEGPDHDLPTRSEIGLTELGFSFEDFRNQIAQCLEHEFGVGTITLGEKAIHLHKDIEEKINADIVPAFTFRAYGARTNYLAPRPLINQGIAFRTAPTGMLVGRWRTNFPEQHYENGCRKNERTGRRFKRVVRILKRLRDHMAGNPTLNAQQRAVAKSMRSFLIECLVYRCPDHLFGNPSIYDDVSAVLNYLSTAFNDAGSAVNALFQPNYISWREENDIKPLWIDQAWSSAEATSFVSIAKMYMGV